ncbi:MAG: hypothetical protein AAB368_10355, partial [bacterium]
MTEEINNTLDIISPTENIDTRENLSEIVRVEVDFNASDLDSDGFIDYIEWNVEHLSNQTYDVIYITKAEHLDENRTFIEEVYDYVKAQDNNWTTIPSGHYLRVTFEQELDSSKDISIYGRSSDGNSTSIEVYVNNQNETIAVFENVSGESWYKVYLTNLTVPEDVFDLRMIGNVDLDYVVDPIAPNLTCQVVTGNCPAGWTVMLRMSNYTNAHAEVVNQSSADNGRSSCCRDTRNVVAVKNNTGVTIARLSNYTNAHAEMGNMSSDDYPYLIYFGSNTTDYTANVSFQPLNGTCPTGWVCAFTLSNQTNAHVSSCNNTPENISVCLKFISTIA